jgi:hypothetical protein
MLPAADMADVTFNLVSTTQCIISAVMSLIVLVIMFLVFSNFFVRVTILISGGEVHGLKHGQDSSCSN